MRIKIVSETLFEFERGIDPKVAMGLGMRERIKKMMEKNHWRYEDDDRALRWASNFGHVDIVEFLLKVGVDIHTKNDAPLRWALHKGHKDVVELLLKAGADIHALDDNVLRYASKKGHTDIVELLKKWMKKK